VLPLSHPSNSVNIGASRVFDSIAVANPQDPLLAAKAPLIDLVEAVRALPYGRTRDRSVDGLLRERRGTCSTKHLFLARALAGRFPHTQPRIVHRVYRIDREQIRERYGDEVAAAVPEDGRFDVHRYLLIRVGGRQITLDVTFPGGEPWDGRSSLPLACGQVRMSLQAPTPIGTSRRSKHITATLPCESPSSQRSGHWGGAPLSGPGNFLPPYDSYGGVWS